MADALGVPPLSLIDQVFVNALACLVMPVASDAAERDLWRGLARDMRAQVTRDHRFLSPLITSFTAYDTEGAPIDIEAARLRLLSELLAFFRWRCVAAYDRLSSASER